MWSELVVDGPRALLATILLVGLVLFGRGVARRSELGGALAAVVGTIAAIALVALSFWLLAPFGWFAGGPVAALTALAAAAVSLRPAPTPDAPAPSTLAGFDRRWWWWLVLPTLMLAVRTARALVAPCVGWDGLTYHMFRAGDWVQTGSWTIPRGPDYWQSYGAFPVLGDAFWAWAMVALRADTVVPMVEVALLAAAALGLFAAARGFGASHQLAVAVAAAVVSLPPVAAQVGAAYVDVAVLATFCLGLAALVAGLERHSPLLLAAAVAAHSLMVGIKLTAAFVAIATGVLVLVCLLRHRPRFGVGAWLGIALASLLGAPSYLRNAIEFGSPLFPFLDYNLPAPGLAQKTLAEGEWWRLLLWQPVAAGAFTAPGIAALVLLVLAFAGATTGRLRRGDWVLLAAFVSALALVLGPEAARLRETVHVASVGRYLLPSLAACALLAARLGPRATPGLLVVANIAALQAWPRGWHLVERGPLIALGLLVLGLLVLARLARPVAPLIKATCLLVLGLLVLTAVRDRARYPLWDAAADSREPFFLMHRIHPVYANAWGLWRALDDGAGHTIAVAWGWDGLGFNAYLYPWQGRRLANRVLFVPVSADGAIVGESNPELRRATASYDAWIKRLAAADVDVVVSLAPRTSLEDEWLTAHPEHFTLVARDEPDFHRVYAFEGGGTKD